MSDQPRLDNRTVTGGMLRWGHPQLSTIINSCSFRDCFILLDCPAQGLILLESTFSRCTIKAAKRFRNHQFFDVTFEGCTFIGDFEGCEFGYRPLQESSLRGYVRGCDFSQAKLDAVSINSSDPETLRFPSWPYFVVLSPSVYREVPALDADPEWRLWGEVPWMPETAAVVHHYRTRGKNSFTVPESEALAALRGHNAVRIADSRTGSDPLREVSD